MNRLTRFLATASLVVLSHTAFAAEVLLKEIPGGSYFSEAVYAPLIEDETAFEDPFLWNPGFRNASVGGFVYLTGWTKGSGAADDGFISKIDPAGSIVWTKTMRSVFSSTKAWKVNDIKALGDRLFVCGTVETATGLEGKGFVAKLTLDGTLVDYSMVRAEGGVARGNSLAIGSQGQTSIITLVGDAYGSKLVVEQKQVSNDTDVFGGDATNYLGLINPSSHQQKEAYIVNFDENLGATWAVTLGNDTIEPDSFGSTATAVEADNTGAIFVALMTNTHARQESTRYNFTGDPRPDVTRKVAYLDTDNTVKFRQFQSDLSDTIFGYDYDLFEGSFSLVYRIVPERGASTSEITHHFHPIRLGESERGADSRISKIVYSDGSLFVAGEFRQLLYPSSTIKNVSAANRASSVSDSSDIWVGKLSANNLEQLDFRIYSSSEDDLLSDLTVGNDQSLYLSGVAGGALSTRALAGSSAALVSASVGNNSSKAHLFWQKISMSSLTPANNWHIAPVEETSSSIAPPSTQRVASLGVTGNTVVILGSWKDGDLTMGPDSATRKTLIGSNSEHKGFVGFMNSSGSFLEEVQIAINSEYGNPTPHGGLKGSPASVATVAAGRAITASVPAVVYEDVNGNILDAANSDAIRNLAVTRRVNVGYQFRNSTQNGTANSVTFVAGSDTELTFLWRTEHAIQVNSALGGIEGLTSLSAGNPSPAVNKHWIEEGESFVASINGWESDPEELGVRWRSLGYVAEGVVAEAAAVESGEISLWEELQNRQQTPEIVVNGSGKLSWLWRKEYRIRQAVNSSVAEGSPTLTWVDQNVLAGDFDASTSIFFRNTFSDNSDQYAGYPTKVTRDEIKITFNEGAPPAKLKIQAADVFHAWRDVFEVDVPSGTQQGDTVVIQFSAIAGKWFEMVGKDSSGNAVSAKSSQWELRQQSAARNITRNGAGEYWVTAGQPVTVAAPSVVDSGLSTLDLKGYYLAQGDIAPSEARGVSSKVFNVTQPSSITWDYARAIYPETVTVGSTLTFSGVTGADGGRIDTSSPPVAGNVSTGPDSSTFETMQIWDEVQNKLFVLQPGKFTVEFKNSAAPDDPAKNIIVEVTVDWPSQPNYTHVIETPPVNLDDSPADGTSFVRLAHTESRATVAGTRFSAKEAGRSILLFSHRASGESNGDLERESLSVKVVNSIHWETAAGETREDVTIGEAVTSAAHEPSSVGHNGYVIHDLAPVNVDLYDRATRAGSIFPVNQLVKYPTGMSVHFPFDETSGTTAGERISGTTATFVTTSGSSPQWSSPGFQPDDTTGDYFKSQDSSIGNLSANQVTTAAWISPATFTEWGGIVTKGETKIVYTMNVTLGKKLRFSVNYNNPTGSIGSGMFDSTGLLVENTYQHVAATYDGANVRLYINGQLDSTHPASFTLGSLDEALVIGVDLPGDDEFFDGKIRDVMVFDRALRGDEVAYLSAPSFIPEDENLAVAWYRVQDDIRWPYTATNYNPKWPTVTDRIVVASQLGSEGQSGSGVEQPLFGSTLVNPEIYQQPDPDSMGFNPNEEHALVAASFLDTSRSAVFALRNDLNQSDTSEPYVLVQYEDVTNPANPVARMKVYSIYEEDTETTDTRLPAFNQIYTYLYQNEAGLRLKPPYPLDVVIGASPTPPETNGLNVDGRISYYEDKNGMPWCVSGDTDLAADIEAAWYYPLRADFWHPSKEFGEAVSYGKLTSARPRNVAYNTVWPADVAVLKAGETLTFSGGEYATDNNTAVPSPRGLPQAVSWQSAKQVFDEANVALTPGQLDSDYLARAFPALTSYRVPLALTLVPESLRPAAGNVIVDGLLWRFKGLPASLQERVYYDTSTESLGVRGVLNGRVLGDGDLLVTPGAQTILQANVLTESDEVLVENLAVANDWKDAVALLASTSRDPNETEVINSLGIGLDSGTSGLEPANSFGPGIVVVTNPNLQRSGTAGTAGGYITIAENDSPELPDSPVAMHVIRVSKEKYRGSIAVLEPSNVFDEKVTLRHTADFGGDVKDLYFEWILREEDGRDLNPRDVDKPTAGEPSSGDWTTFVQGVGAFEAQLSGSGPIVIQDNLAFVRYRHKDDDGTDPDSWSAWAGAANSRPPNTDSASVDTDQAYVPQLVRGWVKRVVAAVNLFDARFKDFGNNSSPATYTSALQQAGQRWEGPVAFNPEKDAIENVGLIELYQTVLDRGEAFTIASQTGTDGVNTALLNAANRIAGLYTMLGNEAYADALDPLIGFSTAGGQFGTLAPTIHAFENQSAGLLDEELALLRGRSEVGARPAYNRLIWNFTNGSGEAAYVLNYGINDLTNDGFLDDEDARRLYPQGHGDAWGHYSMALKGYYDLASDPNFTWSARSEKYDIDGVVLDIDYLDERAFARTAAARARCGAELVDLTYRQSYTENPDGQWQGYQDTNTDRAWGTFETAQRTGTAALCDWLFVNAMLPAKESDTAKTGIRKVDRTTVGEIAEIAQQASKIQANLDLADRGLNPAGLNPDMVPFDIDPVLTDRNHEDAATHFEQVYARATTAAKNANRTFDYANGVAAQLRATEASSETLRTQAIDQDLSYRNRMIEVFGTPYAGQIGSGKAYPEGYSGPDLYLWMYVDLLSAGSDILDDLSDTTVETTITPGLRNLANNTNPFSENAGGVDDLLRDSVSKYFPNDVDLPSSGAGELTLSLPRRANGYGLVAPDGWGQRRSPGEIQAAIQELVQAEWRVRTATATYEAQADDFAQLLRLFEIKSGLASNRIQIVGNALDEQALFTGLATGAFAAAGTADYVSGLTDRTFDILEETLPKIVGLSNDPSSAARGILGSLAGSLSEISASVSLAAQIAQYSFEVKADQILLEMDQDLLTEDLKSELVDILFEMQGLINAQGDLLFPIIDAIESMRLASDRVRMSIEKGQALLAERTVFNQRVAATTTQQRYEDYTFRIFHYDALRKYRSSFDLAARYAYLAGKAYQYELNLSDGHSANADPLLAEILRERTLGHWEGEEPVIGAGGVAEHLAVLDANFQVLKGQLGFNNPDSETVVFSLRRELARIGSSSRVNADWRTQLESWRVPDLWNFEYQNNGVNYGYIFRRYCRPFAPESAGAQPALVIPFSTTIEAGKNWFGNPITGGDNAFNASNFSTKIRAVGVRLDSYNNIALSQTPQAYLVPVGVDQMFIPDSNILSSRTWNVVDQRIPAPISIQTSTLNSPNWQPSTGSSSGYFEDLRKFSSFRAYHDAGGWSTDDMLSSSRLVGRSVWNTQWVLIIPSASLLDDAGNSSAGIDTLIHGAPLAGYDQTNAGSASRDQVGISDIRLLLNTYSVSGN